MNRQFPNRLMEHALPSHTDQFSRVLSEPVNRLLSLDTERLRHLWNPWKAHVDDLPYLAWALSVDIWRSEWHETKKRSVIASAVEHHRIKGTLEGLRAYLGLVDVTIERVRAPSHRIFSGPSLTREDREKWLSHLPQVRIYFAPEPAEFQSSTFSSGLLGKSFVGLDYLVPSTAGSRMSRRAAYVVDGVERDARIEQDGTLVRINLPAKRAGIVFSGTTTARSYMGENFFIPSTARERIVTIAPVSVSAWRVPIGPSLEPVTSEPELIRNRGNAGNAAFCNDTILDRFFLPSSANQRVFERYAIDDGRQANRRPAIQFMGMDAYGVPGHTAEVKVKIRSKRSSLQAGDGIFVPREKFWIPHDPKPLEETCQAASAAMRASDRILLDTKTPSGFIAGLPFIAGSDEFIV